MNKNIKYTHDGFIIYKGVNLWISRESLMGLNKNTELDPEKWLEEVYNKVVSSNRDELIEKLIKKDV